jgi:hypothetical protein
MTVAVTQIVMQAARSVCMRQAASLSPSQPAQQAARHSGTGTAVSHPRRHRRAPVTRAVTHAACVAQRAAQVVASRSLSLALVAFSEVSHFLRRVSLQYASEVAARAAARTK